MRLFPTHRSRPRGRQDRVTRPPVRPNGDFWSNFDELLTTRNRYDALRRADGSLIERSLLLDRMHELRFELARGRGTKV